MLVDLVHQPAKPQEAGRDPLSVPVHAATFANGCDTVSGMWEYMTLEQKAGWVDDMTLQLNALGSIGWEVVAFVSAAPLTPIQILTAILKRPVVPWPALDAGNATWAADPTGRFPQRYWDGARWTQHVTTTGGVADIDWPNHR